MPMSKPEQPSGPEREIDPVVRRVVLEVESHVADGGWDQPGRLYALVPTTELIRAEPELAAKLGLDDTEAAGTLTPVEQDEVPADRQVEALLAEIAWPPQVVGCAVVVERLVLPPSAEEELPAPPGEQAEYAAAHPDRQEVRLAVAVTRDGRAHCAIRMRAHDSAAEVLDGPSLVPELISLASGTLSD
ncbi:MAG: PPA1309 family protein [Nocardioidaceae bacterium]